jgi:metal-responsive CopG/Arc/MetJ family transcriptional regulator
MAYMKTAISIDEGLYRKAEKLSNKLNVSRSQLFAQALEYLLEKSETLEIIQKLNEVYGPDDMDKPTAPKGGKKKMKAIVEKW